MTTAEEIAAESIAEALRSEDGEDYNDQANAQREQATSGAAPSGSLTDVMLLLTRLIQTMPANIAAAVKVDKTSHFDNAKLDVRNFVRIKTFTNKHNEFREWKSQFAYAVAECDNVFASTLSGLEKAEKPIDAKADLTPTQAQLSSVLFNRLHRPKRDEGLQIGGGKMQLYSCRPI